MYDPSNDIAPKINALVLAAGRDGYDDPVAKLQGKSHKCLVEIDGIVMIERVLLALIESGFFKKIFISIEDEDVLKSIPKPSAWLGEDLIEVIPSKGNLADSVLAAVDAIDNDLPLLITTGDNALHTPELIEDFMTKFWAGDGDVAVAFTRGDIVKQDFPDVGLAYHKMKDGEFSACNLYALRRENALKAVKVFESGGQFGKRHIRILKSFGIMPFLMYKSGLATCDGLMQRIGRNLGVSVDSIMLPFPYGPIDVDNPQFFEISEQALKRRRENRAD